MHIKNLVLLLSSPGAKQDHILKADQSSSLNSRRELLSKCRHRAKYLLKKCSLPYKTTEQRGQGITEHFFTTS
jgi:hypothetical protein